MSDIKWTKGPWFITGSVPEEGFDCFWIKAQPHQAMRGFTKDIATVDGYQDEPERLANARLIATAPELYSLLEQYVKAFESKTRGCNLEQVALDVLAKARGELGG